jgi:hypothetical protein
LSIFALGCLSDLDKTCTNRKGHGETVTPSASDRYPTPETTTGDKPKLTVSQAVRREQNKNERSELSGADGAPFTCNRFGDYREGIEPRTSFTTGFGLRGLGSQFEIPFLVKNSMRQTVAVTLRMVGNNRSGQNFRVARRKSGSSHLDRGALS